MDVESGIQDCFATFALAMADLSDGTLGFDANVETLTQAQAATLGFPIVAASSSPYVLAIVYDNANYGGSSLTFTASGPCDTNADVDWQNANIGSTWNDRISSFKSYSDCQTKIFENANFGGASYGSVSNTTYVGDAMNDRTTSIKWL
jgi:hypothetical protein